MGHVSMRVAAREALPVPFMETLQRLDDDIAARKLFGHLRHHARRMTLAEEGAPCGTVFIVLDGAIATIKALPGGGRQILDMLFAGDIADPASPSGSHATYSIETLGPATVAQLAQATWRGMRQAHPAVERLARRNAAASRARLAERMLRLGRGSARMRLAYALIELDLRLRAVGHASDEGCAMPLNQQDLGDFVGLSSVHVCRTLGRFVAEDIIEIEGHRRVRILKPAALAAIAEVDHLHLDGEISPFSAAL